MTTSLLYKSIRPLAILILSIAVLSVRAQSSASGKNLEVDICVYGATSSGVIAAYAAKKMGRSVILIEPGRHLGGMTSGGLGFTDIGNKYVVTGLARDFYRRIGRHYGKFEQWIFEPKVAEDVYRDYVKRAGLNVLYESRLSGVQKNGAAISTISLENSYDPGVPSITVKARMFIDCTYEGDLMAKAGASYTVGREANATYNETVNGVQFLKGHQFPDGIDPYKTPGDPSSGLVWGINSEPMMANGSGDKKVQAYCFRTVLTNVPDNRVEITRPDNYDSSRYELWLRLMNKGKWKTMTSGFIWSKMPNGKTDINNSGGFSMDMIGMNWDYPDADYKRRAEIWKAHEDYTKGLFYFIGHDPRIPKHLQDEMKQWGYPKDEYTDNNNWSHQLYVREARRLVGELVMTQHHCQGREVVGDGVGMAAYTMDSHNCDRHAINGMVKNEGNVEVGGFGPYPISYRAIVPKRNEVSNLLVPVCLSASHIAYGSIRMEPVFMVLGQSSAVAASLAIEQQIAIQDVDVKKIQSIIKADPLSDGSKPEIIVDNADAAAVQFTGSWKKESYGGYGPDFVTATAGKNESPSARFTLVVQKKGRYMIYVYYPKLKDEAEETSVTIFDGKKKTEKILLKSAIQVEGQTSGEWVPVGKYKLSKGSKAYIEIANKAAAGAVAADAVLLVPEK